MSGNSDVTFQHLDFYHTCLIKGFLKSSKERMEKKEAFFIVLLTSSYKEGKTDLINSYNQYYFSYSFIGRPSGSLKRGIVL